MYFKWYKAYIFNWRSKFWTLLYSSQENLESKIISGFPIFSKSIFASTQLLSSSFDNISHKSEYQSAFMYFMWSIVISCYSLSNNHLLIRLLPPFGMGMQMDELFPPRLFKMHGSRCIETAENPQSVLVTLVAGLPACGQESVAAGIVKGTAFSIDWVVVHWPLKNGGRVDCKELGQVIRLQSKALEFTDH